MATEGGRLDRSRDRWLRRVMWGGAAALLLLPAVAMRISAEVDWTALDFAVFGVMLTLACGAGELALRADGGWSYRLAAALAVLAGFLLAWANLAVGVVGEPGNPANLMHLAVLLVAVAGAFVARLQAPGMARTMLATAAVQGLAAVATLWLGSTLEAVLTGVFAAAWLLSAALFRIAAR